MPERSQGRLAGFTYLGVVLTGMFSLAYAPRELIALGEPAVTLGNFNERFSLFVLMIVAGVVMACFFAALPFTLARFLRAHGQNAARLMIGLAVASLPFTLLAFSQYAVLAAEIAGGAAEASDVVTAREGFRWWLSISIFFWGAWLAPLGWLVLKSRAIPRLLGVFLVVGSIGYIADLLGPHLIEGFAGLPLAEYARLPASIGELGTCLWLVVFGARPAEAIAR